MNNFLEVKNITKSFGDVNVLRGIDFSLAKGDVLAIIGSSGSGKTTLLRSLNFLETPDTGEIVLDGKKLFDAASAKSVSDAEKCTPALFHAVAGAYYAETVFGFTDEDFLNSIRYHTVGRAGMSRLEEIVYIADLTSEERDYKDVDKMRRYSRQSIEKAMLEALTFSIESVIKKGSLIPVHTTEAYNFYRSALNEKNGKKSD